MYFMLLKVLTTTVLVGPVLCDYVQPTNKGIEFVENVRDDNDDDGKAISKLMQLAEENQRTIKHLEERLVQQGAIIDQIQKQQHEQDGMIDERVFQAITQTIGPQANPHLKIGASIPVAFSAYIDSERVDLKVPKTIIFNSVVINDGEGYDKNSGVFTAPISGVYVFSFHIVVTYEAALTAYLLVNEKPFAVALVTYVSEQSYSVGGNMAVVQMYKGDNARVHGVQFFGDRYVWYPSFSGFLLYIK